MKTVISAFFKSILCIGVFILSLYFVPLLQMFWMNTGIIDLAFDVVEEYTVEKVKYAVIGDAPLKLELASSQSEIETGLSNHMTLEMGYGMWFIFEEVGYHGIWMKNMNFAIDIIWFDSSMKVVHIEENVKPETYPSVFRPDYESKYVLEVPAGFVRNQGIKIQDWISFL